MMSQHGIPKPVYHAMKMLRDAGDERLDLGCDATAGEVGYAAFRKDNELQVLLFRQKMKNLELPPEPVHLCITGWEGNAAVTVRRVDENHGNPLKLWEEMGKPVELNRAEVEELKNRSAVEEEIWPASVQDGCVLLNAELGVNDVYFFTIRKA